MRMMRVAVSILLVSIFFVSGCGYQLGLVGRDMSIQKIYLYTVVNNTRRPGLEMHATNAIIRAVQRYGAHLEVVSDVNQADTYMVVKLDNIDRVSCSVQ